MANFTTSTGSASRGPLVEGTDGDFRGATVGGAGGNGAVFKVTKTGTLSTVAMLNVSNGSQPYGGLVIGPDGNYYGTTHQGGTGYRGLIFRVTPAGTLTTVFNFADDPLSTGGPNVEPVLAADGNLYGTTQNTIYRLVFPGAPVAVTDEASAVGTAGGVCSLRIRHGRQ